MALHEHPTQEKILDPIRARLLEAIQNAPGCTQEELLARTHLPRRRGQILLQGLRDTGQTYLCRDGRLRRWFPHTPGIETNWYQILALQNPDTCTLYDWLKHHGGQAQAQVIKQANTWGWSSSKARRHIHRLRNARLATRTGTKGSWNSIRPRDPDPDTAQLLATTTKSTSCEDRVGNVGQHCQRHESW